MIRSVSVITRTIAPPGLPGRLTNHSWLGAEMRVSAMDMEGFVWDSAFLPRPPSDGRAYVVLPVEGPVRVLAAGVVVGPGAGVVFPSVDASFDERVVIFPRHRAVALRVERHLVRLPPRLATFPVDLDVVERVYGAVSSANAFAEPIAALVSALSAAHVLHRSAARLGEAEEPADEPVARALTLALTAHDPCPPSTLVEGSLALSERHARRRVDSFLVRHRMPFARWRDLRKSFSLTGAALALSLPGISTEAASRAGGFASPTGLCHAFQRAALPSPQEIARAHASLREEYGDGAHARTG